MEVTGRITKVLEKQSGTSKDGKEWVKLSFILDNNETYNNIFCFEVFGTEKVENFEKYNKVGQDVKVDFNVSTNEWKDKYYTSLQAWKIFSVKDEEAFKAAPNQIDSVVADKDENNDLPF